MNIDAKVITAEEQTPAPVVQPLGPGHSTDERLLWLEFAAVQIRQDVNGLVLTLADMRKSLDTVKSRVTLMSGIIIGVMAVFKMLPDKSLDLLRHFLAG